MRHLLQSLIILFAVIAVASPSFAGNDREYKKWDRDKKGQHDNSKKENHTKKGNNVPAKVDILIDALVVCPPNSPERFVDNGDGTICDHETGLMWELKDAADGSADDDNPNDVDNRYSWSDDADGDDTNPDGTAFTWFLAKLNGVIASRPGGDVEASQQLGGYSDWRLPTSAELQTILDCSFDPCIDPIFGPTVRGAHWTSTTLDFEQFNAWSVDFGSFLDDLSLFDKEVPLPVRAVRGGR